MRHYAKLLYYVLCKQQSNQGSIIKKHSLALFQGTLSMQRYDFRLECWNPDHWRSHLCLMTWPDSWINTPYMKNSTLVSRAKMEYGWNFSISGLKMMMKSGLGKIFLKFFHALTMLFLLLNLYFWSKFSNKNDMVSARRNFKNIFPRPLFIIIFRPEMLKFHQYSISTGDTKVEFVIYCVLSICCIYRTRHNHGFQ